jgi:hypothetical protein
LRLKASADTLKSWANNNIISATMHPKEVPSSPESAEPSRRLGLVSSTARRRFRLAALRKSGLAWAGVDAGSGSTSGSGADDSDLDDSSHEPLPYPDLYRDHTHAYSTIHPNQNQLYYHDYDDGGVHNSESLNFSPEQGLVSLPLPVPHHVLHHTRHLRSFDTTGTSAGHGSPGSGASSALTSTNDSTYNTHPRDDHVEFRFPRGSQPQERRGSVLVSGIDAGATTLDNVDAGSNQLPLQQYSWGGFEPSQHPHQHPHQAYDEHQQSLDPIPPRYPLHLMNGNDNDNATVDQGVNDGYAQYHDEEDFNLINPNATDNLSFMDRPSLADCNDPTMMSGNDQSFFQQQQQLLLQQHPTVRFSMARHMSPRPGHHGVMYRSESPTHNGLAPALPMLPDSATLGRPYPPPPPHLHTMRQYSLSSLTPLRVRPPSPMSTPTPSIERSSSNSYNVYDPSLRMRSASFSMPPNTASLPATPRTAGLYGSSTPTRFSLAALPSASSILRPPPVTAVPERPIEEVIPSFENLHFCLLRHTLRRDVAPDEILSRDDCLAVMNARQHNVIPSEEEQQEGWQNNSRAGGNGSRFLCVSASEQLQMLNEEMASKGQTVLGQLQQEAKKRGKQLADRNSPKKRMMTISHKLTGKLRSGKHKKLHVATGAHGDGSDNADIDFMTMALPTITKNEISLEDTFSTCSPRDRDQSAPAVYAKVETKKKEEGPPESSLAPLLPMEESESAQSHHPHLRDGCSVTVSSVGTGTTGATGNTGGSSKRSGDSRSRSPRKHLAKMANKAASMTQDAMPKLSDVNVVVHVAKNLTVMNQQHQQNQHQQRSNRLDRFSCSSALPLEIVAKEKKRKDPKRRGSFVSSVIASIEPLLEEETETEDARVDENDSYDTEREAAVITQLRIDHSSDKENTDQENDGTAPKMETSLFDESQRPLLVSNVVESRCAVDHATTTTISKKKFEVVPCATGLLTPSKSLVSSSSMTQKSSDVDELPPSKEQDQAAIALTGLNSTFLVLKSPATVTHHGENSLKFSASTPSRVGAPTIEWGDADVCPIETQVGTCDTDYSMSLTLMDVSVEEVSELQRSFTSLLSDAADVKSESGQLEGPHKDKDEAVLRLTPLLDEICDMPASSCVYDGIDPLSMQATGHFSDTKKGQASPVCDQGILSSYTGIVQDLALEKTEPPKALGCADLKDLPMVECDKLATVEDVAAASTLSEPPRRQSSTSNLLTLPLVKQKTVGSTSSVSALGGKYGEGHGLVLRSQSGTNTIDPAHLVMGDCAACNTSAACIDTLAETPLFAAQDSKDKTVVSPRSSLARALSASKAVAEDRESTASLVVGHHCKASAAGIVDTPTETPLLAVQDLKGVISQLSLARELAASKAAAEDRESILLQFSESSDSPLPLTSAALAASKSAAEDRESILSESSGSPLTSRSTQDNFHFACGVMGQFNEPSLDDGVWAAVTRSDSDGEGVIVQHAHSPLTKSNTMRMSVTMPSPQQHPNRNSFVAGAAAGLITPRSKAIGSAFNLDRLTDLLVNGSENKSSKLHRKNQSVAGGLLNAAIKNASTEQIPPDILRLYSPESIVIEVMAYPYNVYDPLDDIPDPIGFLAFASSSSSEDDSEGGSRLVPHVSEHFTPTRLRRRWPLASAILGLETKAGGMNDSTVATPRTEKNGSPQSDSDTKDSDPDSSPDGIFSSVPDTSHRTQSHLIRRKLMLPDLSEVLAGEDTTDVTFLDNFMYCNNGNSKMSMDKGDHDDGTHCDNSNEHDDAFHGELHDQPFDSSSSHGSPQVPANRDRKTPLQVNTDFPSPRKIIPSTPLVDRVEDEEHAHKIEETIERIRHNHGATSATSENKASESHSSRPSLKRSSPAKRRDSVSRSMNNKADFEHPFAHPEISESRGGTSASGGNVGGFCDFTPAAVREGAGERDSEEFDMIDTCNSFSHAAEIAFGFFPTEGAKEDHPQQGLQTVQEGGQAGHTQHGSDESTSQKSSISRIGSKQRPGWGIRSALKQCWNDVHDANTAGCDIKNANPCGPSDIYRHASARNKCQVNGKLFTPPKLVLRSDSVMNDLHDTGSVRSNVWTDHLYRERSRLSLLNNRNNQSYQHPLSQHQHQDRPPMNPRWEMAVDGNATPSSFHRRRSTLAPNNGGLRDYSDPRHSLRGFHGEDGLFSTTSYNTATTRQALDGRAGEQLSSFSRHPPMLSSNYVDSLDAQKAPFV